MSKMTQAIKKDLSDLYEKNVIQSAKELNKVFRPEHTFDERRIPQYFTGKLDAKTVFVMLNPGSAPDKSFSFEKNEKSNHKNPVSLYNWYFDYHANFGSSHSEKIDSFDLKQAAFLFDFKNSGIKLPDFFSDPDKKMAAQKLVLNDKLQLELVPYCSRSFTGFLDNHPQARMHLPYFLPHIERLLDEITQCERKYVIFGSRQFSFLFTAYAETGHGDVKLGPKQSTQIEGLVRSVSFQKIEIAFNGKVIKGIIPHTFPSQNLTNAYQQMRQYGSWCYIRHFITL